MNGRLVERHFGRIGARAKVQIASDRDRMSELKIDVGRDVDGEFFDITSPGKSRADVRVVDVQPRIRHLLLMSEQDDGKHKFLCGHDERHWFVAAVPERQSVSDVQSAFDALKPVAVRQLEQQLKVKPRKRNRRRNEAFVRQGEWFFVPVSGVRVDERLVVRNEPISRGGGKPHICEELLRQGGELVYVSPQHRRGITETQFRRLISRQPKLRNLSWNAQRRNPLVFVRGKVRHSDHKTIVLNDWHQVMMNTEDQAVAMRHVAFID